MFGRLRPPPSSPDSLERNPAKIIKHDPLSVYESTLLKLRQGSRLDTLVPSSETEVEIPSSSSLYPDTKREIHDCDDSGAMAIDSASGECESSKQQENKNRSVLSMFCRYKNQAQARNVSHTVDTTRTETENAL